MSNACISEGVRKFIIEKISSIGQLEVLLLFYKSKEKSWTADAIAAEMRSSDIAASKHLNDLCSLHLLSKQPEGDPNSYTMSKLSKDQEEAVCQLAGYYNEYRVSILSLIYEKPADSLRYFSEAFIIKRDK